MDGKTMTDAEMMIFAFSFTAKRTQLKYSDMDEEKKVLIAYKTATDDANSIRTNSQYLTKKLDNKKTNTEVQILRKILGLPPEE